MNIRPVTKQADNYLFLQERLTCLIFKRFKSYELEKILNISHTTVSHRKKEKKLKPNEIVIVINHLIKNK